MPDRIRRRALAALVLVLATFASAAPASAQSDPNDWGPPPTSCRDFSGGEGCWPDWPDSMPDTWLGGIRIDDHTLKVGEKLRVTATNYRAANPTSWDWGGACPVDAPSCEFTMASPTNGWAEYSLQFFNPLNYAVESDYYGVVGKEWLAIEGRVEERRPGGKLGPADGVTVTASSPGYTPKPTTTNGGGVYTLWVKKGTYAIAVNGGGRGTFCDASALPQACLPRVRRAVDDDITVNWKQTGRHHVRGKVVDAKGDPIRSAVIRVRSESATEGGTFSDTTEPDGTYDVEAPEGRVAVEAEDRTLAVDEGEPPLKKTKALVLDADAVVNFKRAIRRVRGKVTNSEDKPIKDAPIRAHPLDPAGEVVEGKTKGDGTYDLVVPADVVRVDSSDDTLCVKGKPRKADGTCQADERKDLDPVGVVDFQRPCSAEGIDRPAAQTLSGALGWSMHAAVSEDDGVVLTDVRLGDRHLADRISLPYYAYDFGGKLGRGELVSDGDQKFNRSRLTKYKATANAAEVRVTATYEIGRLPRGACLLVTQDYAFSAPVAGDHCEPSGKVPCARFAPVVRYELVEPPAGVDRYEVTLPQRWGFRADAKPFNVASLMLDQDTPSPVAAAQALGAGVAPLSAPVIRDQINPIRLEVASQVIRGGASTSKWDNFHQTHYHAVSAPAAVKPPLEALKDIRARPHRWADVIAIPGCPECVHMHWRWTPLTMAAAPLGWKDHNFGQANVPAGSDQDVTVGVVNARGGEEDPMLYWHSLVDGELTNGLVDPVERKPSGPGDRAVIALWYEGTGRKRSDSFAEHGGFYAYDGPGTPRVRSVKLVPKAFPAAPESIARGASSQRAKKATGGAKLTFALSEWGDMIVRVEQRRGRRTVLLDEFTATGGTGALSVPFDGRVNGKALAPGRYRLVVRARDVSGDPSKQVTVPFRIVAPS